MPWPVDLLGTCLTRYFCILDNHTESHKKSRTKNIYFSCRFFFFKNIFEKFPDFFWKFSKFRFSKFWILKKKSKTWDFRQNFPKFPKTYFFEKKIRREKKIIFARDFFSDSVWSPSMWHKSPEAPGSDTAALRGKGVGLKTAKNAISAFSRTLPGPSY